MNTYDIGDRIGVEMQFYDANGAPADPNIVRFKYIDGSGNSVTVTAPNASISHVIGSGYYLWSTVGMIPGMWHWRWEGEGGIDTAEEGSFRILPSNFP